mgnify:CR=1 FL=1
MEYPLSGISRIKGHIVPTSAANHLNALPGIWGITLPFKMDPRDLTFSNPHNLYFGIPSHDFFWAITIELFHGDVLSMIIHFLWFFLKLLYKLLFILEMHDQRKRGKGEL